MSKMSELGFIGLKDEQDCGWCSLSDYG